MSDEEILEIIEPIMHDCDGNNCLNFNITSLDDSLYGDLGLSSLTLVESIMLINERLNINITDDELVSIRTVKELINTIKKHIENGK